MLPAALDAGVTPVMVKEIVYQAVVYLGIGRVLPFLKCTNEILTQRGVTLPLEGQSTTTMKNRLEKGAQAQADIFGPQMLEAWKAGPVSYTHLDVYKRQGIIGAALLGKQEEE